MIYVNPGIYTVSLTVSDGASSNTKTVTAFVTAFERPDVNFSTNSFSGCAPFSNSFTDQTTLGDAPLEWWRWDFGDANFSVEQNPNHTYADSGYYTVTLTVGDSNGCQHAMSVTVTSYGMTSANADFTSDMISENCFGITQYTLTDHSVSSSAITTWSWDFDDGGTSTSQNPTHDFAAAGQYDVMLIITNADGCSDTVTKPVTVAAASVPVADFTTNDAPVCLPETIGFSDASVSDSAIISWNWAFGDGGSSTLQNPSHTYTTVGTFSVTLIIETVAGCRDTVSKTVETNGSSLIANAGPDAAICIGDTTVLAGSGGSSFSWNNSASLSNPNISSPSAFPATTTIYTLTIYDSLGCAATDDVTITVHPLPVVSVTPAAICTGDSAQLSASGGVSYSWSPASTLNNANVSNPVANPLSTTAYTVTVADVNGCVNSVNTTLVVHPLPAVSVSASNNTICEGQSVQLNASGGDTYSWSPATWLNDPNISNPVSTPVNSITYIATVIDNNGCENSEAVSITVNPATAHTVSPDTSICGGDTASLLASGGTTYSWFPATGLSCTGCGNPDAFPATTTTYYVDILDGAGCTVKDSVTVTVFSSQSSSVTPDTSICKGSSVQLSASGGDSYTWSPAAGLDNAFVSSPLATPDSSATYTVQITSSSGCSWSDSVHIEVADVVADMTFSGNVGCAPVTVQFTGSSSSTAPIASWLWDFGDGSSSSLQNPSHTFTSVGIFNVTLTVETAAGCRDTVSKTVETSSPSVVADASPDVSICSGDTVALTGSGGLTFSWNPSAYLSNPNISNPSAFPVATTTYVLTVYDSLGCADTDDITVTVVSAQSSFVTSDTSVCNGSSVQLSASGGDSYTWSPAAGLDNALVSSPLATPDSSTTYTVQVTSSSGCSWSDSVHIEVSGVNADMTFSGNVGCAPVTVQFTDSSSSTAPIASWHWDFGDGSSSSLQNPSHTFTSVGIFNVTLTVETTAGCRDTVSETIETSSPSVVADAGADVSICSGDTTALTGSGGLTFSWNPFSYLSNPNISDPSAFPIATTTYVLTVYDSLGCADTDDITVTVVSAQSSSITPDTSVCNGSSVQLSASGGDSYTWSPATGLDNAFVPSPLATPDSSITYTAQITSSSGCSWSDSVRIEVSDVIADMTFSGNVGCAPVTVQFTGSSSSTDPIASWLWDFGDGGSSSLQNPSHTFTLVGIFTVTLTVETTAGCRDTVSETVETSSPSVVADAGADVSICSGDTVALTGSGGLTFSWNPSASLSDANISNPFAFPASTTTYVLTVYDSLGCADTDDITVTVVSAQSSSVTPDTSVCNGSSVQLSASGGDSYTWSPATGLDNAFVPSPLATPDSSITYTAQITSSSGCSWSDSVRIEVSDVHADMTFSGNVGCAPVTVQFTGSSSSTDPITSWLWDFGDGNSSSLQNPSHTFTLVGIFTVTLTVETTAGCRDTVSKTVETSSPSVVADAGADVSICSGDTTLLNGSGGLTFSWNPSAGLSNANIYNPFSFPASTTTYVLTVFDSIGCADTDDVTVTVHPLPVVDASPAAICTGDSAQLLASGGVSYSWSPASTLNDPDISNPVANPLSTTTYDVTVTDANGCVNSVSATLVVHPLPVVNVSSVNKTICYGESVQLSAGGGVNYSWSPATWLSDAAIPNPVSTPLLSTNYSVTATDVNGCESTGSVAVNVYPMPVYSVSPDTSICSGDTVSLSVSGGVSFVWYPAAGLSCMACGNPDAFPAATTTYYVNITDAAGCIVTDSVTVTVFSPQTVSVTPDTFVCSGNSVQLNATGGANYEWSPAAGLDNAHVPFPVASPDSTTTYTVMISSPSGCSWSDSVLVEVAKLNANFSLSENTGCLPFDVQFTDLSSSDDPIASWQWNFDDGNISNDQHPSHEFETSGTHHVTLTVTTAGGCTGLASAPVTVNPLPVAVAGPDAAICDGGAVQLAGSGGIQYIWSPPAGLSATDIPNPTASPDATRYYELIVIDANGCLDMDSVLITVGNLPVTTISPDVSLCDGDSTQLQATGGHSYSWSPAAGLSNPRISNPVARPEASTAYVVYVQTDLGCDAVDSVEVTVHPEPAIAINAKNEICIGDTAQFRVSGALSYQWSPPAGLSCADCPNPVATPDASTTYFLTMTDNNNCIWRETIPLVVNPAPQVHTTNDKTICKGESVELTSTYSGATAFEWTPGFGLNSYDIPSPVAIPEKTTEYVIIARNASGCEASDTVLITVIDQVHAVASNNMRICPGESVTMESQITLSGSAGTSVLWFPQDAFGDPASPVQTVSPTATTTYMLVASGGQCASDTQYVHVHVDEKPDVDAGENQTVMAGTEVTFTAASTYNITSYYWSPSAQVSCADCPATSAIAEESGTYYVSVTDANGCSAIDSVAVNVLKGCDGDIWLPNAFTPNGDESNDLFRVRSMGFIDLISFRIFGRWGNLIFETDDINQGWDGKYKDEFVNPEVYVWSVRATCADGNEVEKSGNVTVIR